MMEIQAQRAIAGVQGRLDQLAADPQDQPVTRVRRAVPERPVPQG